MHAKSSFAHRLQTCKITGCRTREQSPGVSAQLARFGLLNRNIRLQFNHTSQTHIQRYENTIRSYIVFHVIDVG